MFIQDDVLRSHLKKVREHCDELYKLVKESNPDAVIYRAEGIYSEQDSRVKSAMWHGHEINKYISAAFYNLENRNVSE